MCMRKVVHVHVCRLYILHLLYARYTPAILYMCLPYMHLYMYMYIHVYICTDAGKIHVLYAYSCSLFYLVVCLFIINAVQRDV